MAYSEELIKKMQQCGVLGYDLDRIINIIDIEEKEEKRFRHDFDTEGSPIYKAYLKGLDKAKFQLELKLFDKAKNGDMEAMKEFEKRRELNSDIAAQQKRSREVMRENGTAK